jgi:hypothetical protein
MHRWNSVTVNEWCEDSVPTIQRRMHLQSAIMRFMIKRCWSSYNAWKSEMQNWEVCQVFRFVQITKIWNTLWQLKAYRATNEMVFNTVAIQLLHTILAEQAEWESRCFIETEAECVNESLRWQSTTLYDTDNTFWDDKQAYTDCLNDSSRHISLCACTRSELVQWDHRPQTDVSECWSRRWVIQWALSDNLQKQRSFSTVLKVRVFITNASWAMMKKSYSFVKDTECHSQNLFIQNWFSIHMTQQWLNTQKKCNWCLLSWQFFWLRCYRMSVHSAEIVTNAV